MKVLIWLPVTEDWTEFPVWSFILHFIHYFVKGIDMYTCLYGNLKESLQIINSKQVNYQATVLTQH